MPHTIKKEVDHIIVGQGLAGSCLALQLTERGKKIMVFDEPQKNRASSIAAGLFNPITGKFMRPSWLADKIFPFLFHFYEKAQNLLGPNFFHPQPIYRPFISIEEQNEWMGQSENLAMDKFIDKIYTSSQFGHIANDPLGGLLTRQSGYLDTNLFMRAVSDYLKNENAYRESFFKVSELRILPDKVLYENIVASSIIFCDGLNANRNTYFTWLPIQPLKGETLTITLAQKPNVILNRGVYIVPGQQNTYIIGASYKPGDASEGTSVRAREELESKLRELIVIPFVKHHQDWGIRPTTPDRRPVLGPHPVYKNVVIFNGLGTKGVSLAPYFSHLLIEWLEGKEEITTEVNIERFKALYSKLSLA